MIKINILFILIYFLLIGLFNGEKKNQNIKGHRERLREKFPALGLKGFHDYEVIELLLTLATPRKDCKDAVKEVLNKFKTLHSVFEASEKDLCDISGIGQKNVFGIKLIKAVAKRYLKKKIIDKNPINNSKDLFNYLNITIRDRGKECFEVIFLNSKNRIISSETLFSGTLTSSSVYPREIIISALKYKASALIFAHNYPSGDPEPSYEDIFITKQLFFACKIMDITIHEYIIIGNNKYFSFTDNGYIKLFNNEYLKRNNELNDHLIENFRVG